MTDWKLVAAARGVKLSEEDLRRVAPVMDRHQTEYSELRQAIPMELLTATLFVARPPEAKAGREEP